MKRDKMLMGLRRRLRQLEKQISNRFPSFPGDDDGFITALGVDPDRYKKTNPSGTVVGYDMLQALADLAAEDWK